MDQSKCYLVFNNFWPFFNSEKLALHVKEKCVGGQGKVQGGSRRSASGMKEKCVGGQEEISFASFFVADHHTFSWSPKGPTIEKKWCPDLL